MQKKEIDTGELLNKLTKTSNINRFLTRFGDSMDELNFHDYIRENELDLNNTEIKNLSQQYRL